MYTSKKPICHEEQNHSNVPEIKTTLLITQMQKAKRHKRHFKMPKVKKRYILTAPTGLRAHLFQRP